LSKEAEVSSRRSLIRPNGRAASPNRRGSRRQKLQVRLADERIVCARWWKRLKRAFHQVERSMQRIARWERTIVQLED
jgi:hypothetical protein